MNKYRIAFIANGEIAEETVEASAFKVYENIIIFYDPANDDFEDEKFTHAFSNFISVEKMKGDNR